MTAFLGFDPGFTGAIALLHEDDSLTVWDMPVVKIGARGRKALHVPHLVEIIKEAPPGTHAILEQVGARPQESSSGAFKFGEGFGIIQGALGVLEIKTTLVTPSKWKRMMGLTASKDDARVMAMRLWPGDAPLFGQKHDDGRAEAALIAKWGRDHANG